MKPPGRGRWAGWAFGGRARIERDHRVRGRWHGCNQQPKGNAGPAPATRPTLTPDNACRDSERRGTGTGRLGSGWLCRPASDRVRRDEGGDRRGIGSGRNATVPVRPAGDVASRARKAEVVQEAAKNPLARPASRYPASRPGPWILVAHTGVPANARNGLSCGHLSGQETLYESPNDEGLFVLQVQPRPYGKVALGPIRQGCL